MEYLRDGCPSSAGNGVGQAVWPCGMAWRVRTDYCATQPANEEDDEESPWTPGRSSQRVNRKARLLCFTSAGIDFYRALMRLFSRMETTAVTKRERGALNRLKNGPEGTVLPWWKGTLGDARAQKNCAEASRRQVWQDKEGGSATFSSCSSDIYTHVRVGKAEAVETPTGVPWLCLSLNLRAMLESQRKFLEELTSLKAEINKLKCVTSEVDLLREKVRKWSSKDRGWSLKDRVTEVRGNNIEVQASAITGQHIMWCATAVAIQDISPTAAQVQLHQEMTRRSRTTVELCSRGETVKRREFPKEQEE